MRPPVLILPGLFNSGPDHWQSIWESQHPDYKRVLQKDWTTPRCADWMATLDAALSIAGGPFVLAAHSLACVTVARWAKNYPSNGRVHAAFLVAPTDVEAPTFPSGSEGFQPMPLGRLPFPSVVVSSEDDPYVTLHRAETFAAGWGSQFINLGRGGHINADSGHGPWPQGEQWLETLRG
jgi:predicted alpha/beta hydrolase family esterase